MMLQRILSAALVLAVAAVTAAVAVAGMVCTGDCDANGAVAINEVVTCVNVALGSPGGPSCAACDANNDGAVSIEELIQAVNNALGGCPDVEPTAVSPTPLQSFTPTRTYSPTLTATASATPTLPPSRTPTPTTALPATATPASPSTGSCGYLAIKEGSSQTYQSNEGETTIDRVTHASPDHVTVEETSTSTDDPTVEHTVLEFVCYQGAPSVASSTSDRDEEDTWTSDPPLLYFPSETRPGFSQTRTSRLTVSGAPAVSITVTITVLGSEDVTVPAGTFRNATKISFAPQGVDTYIQWYAPGVGLVRSTTDSGFVEELIAYSIP
jgi:hypothetical protein